MNEVRPGDYILNNENQKSYKVATVDEVRVYYFRTDTDVRSVRRDRIHFDHKLRHRNFNWLGPDIYKEAAEAIKRQVLNKTNEKLLSSTALT